MESRDWLYVFGAVALTGAAALALAASGAPALRIGPSDRVLLVGDSLAQGLTAPLGALAADAGVVFQGDGRVSTRLDQWLGQGWLEADLASFQPTVVIASIGTNDAGAVGLMPDFAARAAAAVALAAKYGAKLLWVEPPAMPFPTDSVLAGLRSSGSAGSFPSQNVEIPRGPDQIHPTMGGYAAWAGLLWMAMDPPPGRRTARKLVSRSASALGQTTKTGAPSSSTRPPTRTGLSSLSSRMRPYAVRSPKR